MVEWIDANETHLPPPKGLSVRDVYPLGSTRSEIANMEKRESSYLCIDEQFGGRCVRCGMFCLLFRRLGCPRAGWLTFAIH